MENDRVNKIVLLLIVLGISALFLSMIKSFLIAIVLSGIFSALAQPFYKKLLLLLRGREYLACALTLLSIFLILFLPLIGLLGIVAAQALKVSQSVTPWVQQQLSEPGALDKLFHGLPFYDALQQYSETILQKAGELVSSLSSFLVNGISSATMSTVNFVFLFFIFLYTMFFFLKDCAILLQKIMYYFPLTSVDERRILQKFTSVTKAMLKGTLVIGLLHGTLAGLAFWVVGIDSALFWVTIMTVLSVIPVVGSSLVWIPAVLILLASGAFAKAIALFLFCGLLVGSLDNVLRPLLVGKDTKMHELFILFGTLGGIAMFGVIGFIIGPIIAALFVTVWDIYGETFCEYLPEVGEVQSQSPSEADDADDEGNSKEGDLGQNISQAQ